MVIKHPLATEKTNGMLESNKMVFIVESSANKKEIKDALEKLLKVKVVTVNTHNDPNGEKRAVVRFSNETPAIDVATKLGLM